MLTTLHPKTISVVKHFTKTQTWTVSLVRNKQWEKDLALAHAMCGAYTGQGHFNRFQGISEV